MRGSVFSVDRRQTAILADRYLDVLLGDLPTLLLLAVQAPLIGLLIAGVWSNVDNDSLALYFVLSLSAFFLGAINASREIVKERDLFLRERMFNLSVGSYVLSKLRVQAIVMVLAATALAGIVRSEIAMHVQVWWVAAALIPTALAGTAIGLLISASVRSADKAVMAVPLVVIPQILFSDFVIGERFSGWTDAVRHAMPVYWSYSILEQLRAAKTEWSTVVGGLAVLFVTILVSYLVTVLLLRRARW